MVSDFVTALPVVVLGPGTAGASEKGFSGGKKPKTNRGLRGWVLYVMGVELWNIGVNECRHLQG